MRFDFHARGGAIGVLIHAQGELWTQPAFFFLNTKKCPLWPNNLTSRIHKKITYLLATHRPPQSAWTTAHNMSSSPMSDQNKK